MEKHSRKQRLLLTFGVVGVMGSLAVLGTFAAFTATTTNTGNKIDSGTVDITQHAGSTTLYNVSSAAPGSGKTSCLRVSYNGSLPAAVRLYVSSGITNGTAYNLRVERGSGLTAPAADMNCTGFAMSSVAYDGDLGSFGTSYAAPGAEGKAAAGTWNQNDTVDYKFIITQNDDPTANNNTTAKSSGLHTFTWEARSN